MSLIPNGVIDVLSESEKGRVLTRLEVKRIFCVRMQGRRSAVDAAVQCSAVS